MEDDTTETPNLTQYINLANYVYTSGNSPWEFPSKIGFQAYSYNGQIVSKLISKTGFYGQAFINTNSAQQELIIAFEGTNLAHQPPNKLFQAAQVDDDYDILEGRNAPSFNSALAFTQTVLNDAAADHISPSEIFLDGHSLGAAEAEYVASQTGLPGTTFGAPGITDSNFNPNIPSKLTNYVEYGDPVGNYSADPPEALAPIVKSSSILHFGGQVYTGPIGHRLLLAAISGTYTTGGAGKIAAAGLFSYGFSTYHPLLNYARDLHLKLYNTDSSTGGDANFAKPLFASQTTLLSASAACFRSGTRIETTRGPCAIEDLVVGDVVVTSSGDHRPIRWLGHRTVDCRNLPRPDGVLPIRIAAFAFGPDRPSRDLYVSPGHAICVDAIGEVLIPACALVNGTTVRQVEVDRVTYWHVELDSHDVVLSENLPTESFLEMGNRGFFEEAAVVDLAAGPDAPARTHADFCRPFHDGGPVVEAVRAQLARRAEEMGLSQSELLTRVA